MNNRFRIENNQYIKLDGGSDISVFKHVQAFCVLRYERQSIALGLTVGDNRTLEMHGLGHVGLLRKFNMGTNSGDVYTVPNSLSVMVSEHNVCTVLQ